MSKRYLVVDQNVLRKPDLQNLVDNDPNCYFILTDVALIEMCKSPQWESTLCNSLAILSECPQRTRVSMSVGEAISAEIRTKRSVEGHLLPKAFTSLILELLSALSSGGTSQTLGLIAQKISLIQVEWALGELNHQQNKQGFEDHITATKSILTSEGIRSLRNGSLPREERLSIIYQAAPHVLEDFLQQAGFSVGKAKMFLKTKPIILRYTYLKMWYCLDWIAKGGFDGLLPERATNELMDHDYILIATFFDGVISREVRVNEAYIDICDLLRY